MANIRKLTTRSISELSLSNTFLYLLNTATITIPEDKGPITLEGTIKPRSLTSCSVETHWILQG